MRSHPAQSGETFDWSANFIAQRFRAPEGGYISLRARERLGERCGAFFNGKEGRDDFSIKLRKDSKIREIREIRVQKSTSIIVFQSRPGPSSRRGFLTPSLLASSPPSLSRPQ